MSAAKATLIGFHNYSATLFSKLTLPQGINKDLFIATLMLKAGEFEVLYADPKFMENAIGIWGSKWFRTFSEWLRGTQASWNPIHNYDRIEDITDSGSKEFGTERTADYSDARTANLQDQRTANLQDQTTFANSDTTTQTVSATTEHKVAAYDSTAYQPSSQDTVNNGTSGVSHTGTVTNNTTGTDTTATTGTDTHHISGTLAGETGSESHSDTRTAHIYGNIGVTQASDMLRGFYDISAWNLYDHMADVFTQELLIPVYS